MKKNLSQELKSPYGKSFEPAAITLEQACFQAVSAALPTDQALPLPDKLKLYRMAQKINSGGVQDFSVEELTLIKERIHKTWSNLVIGAAFDILDADYVETSALTSETA
jgi:hypothetical protein